ncbi:NUDIX domain-containing protein [Candidatus Woesearchaeota archaeon]|nr:NUDIX domain-containing protein [Candidatus Woesearchaeota archaeon]
MATESSAGAVIFMKADGERLYLLLHYESGHWDFVKGNIEQGEEEKDTVIRETQEETGITDITFLQDFRETIYYFYTRQGRKISKQAVFYLAETEEEKISLSDEHVGYEWLDYGSAMQRITYNNSKDVLERADKYLKNRNQ